MGFGPFVFWAGGAFGCAGGLVVAGWVDGEVAEEFAGGGVNDADVEVVDEENDGGSGVDSSDADMVEAAVDAQGHDAGVVDAVVSDAVVQSGCRVGAALGRAL